ncbi:MAG: hypothetical protein QNJ64_13195 [Crocosphaera sp.]|nr:hypothetical protein [Crocosphaera sp.]
MLERLLLASTVTCLLYFSLQFGQSPGTPNVANQTASQFPIERSLDSEKNQNFPEFTVAQK